jgi:hypothetical protein
MQDADEVSQSFGGSYCFILQFLETLSFFLKIYYIIDGLDMGKSFVDIIRVETYTS